MIFPKYRAIEENKLVRNCFFDSLRNIFFGISHIRQSVLSTFRNAATKPLFQMQE